MNHGLLTIDISAEPDLVLARKRARQIAELLGFDLQDQTRVATAVSEIARNAFQYAGAGRVRFSVAESAGGLSLLIQISDAGPGVAALDSVLDGSHRNASGAAGTGIGSARRLMDGFQIESSESGVSVHMEKQARTPIELTAELRARIGEALAKHAPSGVAEEIRQQNRELAGAFESLQKAQSDLELLNRELEETNRGVMVLYNELEEKAESLRRSNASKSKFFSEMNHEVRTPINSILKLSELLLSGTLGAPAPDQLTALGYIQQSARQLSELVDDLLDLAKSEAGRLVVRASSFTAEELFSGLRGMFRSLHTREEVKLIFEDVSGLLPLHTDEGKVAQILRNFISNALKFTDRGSVSVSAELAGEEMIFAVRDTGIGIDPAQFPVLFEPFGQIDSPKQRKVKGTGLGLSLTRALSELLGGRVTLESALGQGTTFRVHVPRVYRAGSAGDSGLPPSILEAKILLIDDDEVARFLLRGVLGKVGCIIMEASGGVEGLERARTERPSLIFLDLEMPNMNGFEVLDALAGDPSTREIPVAIHTSSRLDAEQRARLDGRTIAVLSKELVNFSEGAAEIASVLRKAGLPVP